MPDPVNPPDPDADIMEGWDEDDQKDIRKAAASRVLAGRWKEREAETKQPCSICGKPKNQGEHGEGKCKKKKKSRLDLD